MSRAASVVSGVTRSETKEPDLRDPAVPRVIDDDTADVPGDELRAGSKVGRYVVLYKVGRGGMGIVFAAYDPHLDRRVAIKLMRPRKKKKQKDTKERLLREAQALAKLSHPNVVAVHDVGLIGDRIFVAMDFIEGLTVRRWLSAEERPLRQIIDVFVQAGEALAAAHDAGITHRDFKPDNAIVGKNGRVQVLDFGLARLHAAEPEPEEVVQARIASEDEVPREAVPLSSRGGSALATPDAPETVGARGGVGTPGYMAPEQHIGARTGPATDQFAFCVALFEAVYGKPPFAGEDAATLAVNVSRGRVREVSRESGVPARLRRILLRGLAVKPEDRFASMKALLVQLRQRTGRRRRTALGLMLVALGGSGVTAVALQLWGPRDDPCEAGTDRAEKMWGDEQRAAVADTFESSARPHAKATAERLVTALDAQSAAWVAAYEDACRATYVRHEQSDELFDLRMSCLTHRERRISALAQLLGQADDEVIDNAMQAADSLPNVAACADATTLRERIPLPEDDRLRERIAEQNSRLAHAAALETSGKRDDAYAIAHRVTVAAREIDYAPLLAAALYIESIALEDLARAEDAVPLLREAATLAEVARDDHLLADVRTLLVLVVGDRMGRGEEGMLWADLARATLQRLGGDPQREASLENNVAILLTETEKPEVVLKHQMRALELERAREGEPSQLHIARYSNAIAQTLSDLGRFDEARRRAGEARSMWQRSLGPDHPTVAIAEATLGLIADSEGDPQAALRHHQRSYEMLERALGPGNVRAAEILNNIAITQASLDNMEESERAFREVLKIHQRTFGEEHLGVAQAYQNLGSAISMRGRDEEALEFHRKGLALRERLAGPEHPAVANSLVGLANVLERTDQVDEAVELRERALRIREKIFGADHPDLTIDVANLAHNYLLAQRLEEALAHGERGVRIATSPSVKPDVRAFARLVLAKCLATRRRDHGRVRALVRQAEAELGELPASTERRLIEEVKALPGWEASR